MKVGTDGVLLGAWALGGFRVLDAGTGTGVIALMMAQRYPDALVTAVDIDQGAVLQARQNVLGAGQEARVAVLHERLQALGRNEDYRGRFDAIVSNPPFFADSLKAPDAHRSIARHTDALSYGELMEASWHLLSSEGELSVIVPFDYRRRMEDEATFRGFFPSRQCAVRTAVGKPPRRYLLAFRKHPSSCQREVLTIGDARYRELTQDFYL